MKDDIQNIIHFGPGKLGLGFVVPNLSDGTGKRPVRLILSARYNSANRDVYEILKNKCSYDLVFESPKGPRTERIDNFELIYLDSEQDILTDHLALPQTCLITTAVGSSGIYAVAGIIAQGLAKRASDKNFSPLIILACENPPIDSEILRNIVRENLHSAGFDVEKALSNVFFHKAIVDRVCPRDPAIDSDGRISVPTEEFSEWIILNSNGECGIDEIIPSIKIVNSEKEFRFLEKRKTWLVNSTHLITAFYAWHAGIYRLRDALGDKEIYNHVRLLQDAFIAALYHFGLVNEVNTRESQLETLRQFADGVLTRLIDGPEDTNDRILADWYKWQGGLKEFKSFYEKAFLRVGEPIKILIEKGLLNANPEASIPLTGFLYRMMKFLSMK